MDTISYDDAKAHGFEGFNQYPHLCVDVPGGGFTITCKTPRGKRVTFAFCPTAVDGGDDYECVDVKYHNSPAPKLANGDKELGVMHMIGFTVGRSTFDTRRGAFDSTKPTTLATILLRDAYYPPA